MKKCYTIALIVLIPILSYGQGEYFTTDSLTSFGLKLIDNGDLMNSRICEVKIKDKIVQYSPYEVKEYGFKNGRVYKSREIQLGDSTQKVFMECLTSGETTLFYYRGKGIKTFYLEKDSTLFAELPKKYEEKVIYAEQLSQITSDCFNVSDACKLVNYNKKSLSKLISRYNNCELKPFPFFRYGLLMGYEVSKLIPSKEQNQYLKYFDFNYEGSFSIGIFLDNPVLVSDFSVHMELLFSKHVYSYYKVQDSRELDFVANLSSLSIPFLLRYTYPSNKIRPFINFGPIGSYIAKNETLLFETTMSENTIEINDTKSASLISDIQLGYVIGSGLDYKLNYKNSLFFELRYINQLCQRDSEFYGTSAFCVLTGVNF